MLMMPYALDIQATDYELLSLSKSLDSQLTGGVAFELDKG